MKLLQLQHKKHCPLVLAVGLFAVLCVLSLLVWLACVRPYLDKGRSEILYDDFSRSYEIKDGQTATQIFTYDKDLLAVGVEFYCTATPSGTLAVTLSDADTGEILAHSTGVMQYIIPDQYTILGLDTKVTGTVGRRYALSLTPHYESDATLAVGHSNGTALWAEQMTVGDIAVDGTMALQITNARIGGFLTRFFLLVCAGAAALAAFALWAVLSKKIALHRLVFILVLGLGVIYNLVLPPYSAPDEKYHINQSFTLAVRWANVFSDDEWEMGHVPTTTSFRRESDSNEILQDENTTVFTWQELIRTLTETTDAAFGSHQEYNELQTDQNPLLYLVSAAAVFLAFILHLGFTPALLLGRLANLFLFAALAMWAVKITPVGKRIFSVAALLPMTLHLAASFSRDAPLLGLCFLFTALLLRILGKQSAPTKKQLVALAVCGIWIAPGKLVYLPLAMLALLIPKIYLGKYANAKKTVYLASCLALALALNTALLPKTEAAVPSGSEITAADTRTALAKPAEPDEAYETEICGEKTLEHYVQRLYYFAADARNPSKSEVAFWVAALEQGDTSPAVLGQVFLFGGKTYTDAADFISRASLCVLGADLLQDSNMDLFYQYYAEGGPELTYKAILGTDTAKNTFASLGLETGAMDDRFALTRETLAVEIEAAQATRAAQSVATESDSVTYTPVYILHHLPDTVLLLMRSMIENADHYLRTLVGGSLSYYTLELAWSWVVILYFLLAFAAVPTEEKALPTGRMRIFLGAAGILCCLLAVGGCLLWTPTYYETLYGLQGRYFLPILPLLLLTCLPRKILHISNETAAQRQLIVALALVQFGIITNIMLAVIAR